MSKFAHLYNLPAGEQLLVCLCEDAEFGPCVQYVTEIHGTMALALTPMLSPADAKDILKCNAAMMEAREMIGKYTDEDVKQFRRQLVVELEPGIKRNIN